MLKSVFAEHLYRIKNIRTKGEITTAQSDLENNSIIHNMMLGKGLMAYFYNDLHFYKDPNIQFHEKVLCKEHDLYVEAIVGAVYYNSNYDITRRWILKWLLPLLKRYK